MKFTAYGGKLDFMSKQQKRMQLQNFICVITDEKHGTAKTSKPEW